MYWDYHHLAPLVDMMVVVAMCAPSMQCKKKLVIMKKELTRA